MASQVDGAAAQMDRIYRWQRHIYDLSRKFYLLGRDGLICDLTPAPTDSVLEIGCGTGRNLIAVARRYPGARIYGLDVSEAMLETARASIARAGLSRRITLAQADATRFDGARLFGEAAFDRIFLSYTLSMIPRWQDALARAAEQLAPEGRLHVVDFGQQEGLPAPFRSLLFTWLAAFDVTPREGLRGVLDGVAARHRLTLEWRPMLRGYAWAGSLRRR